MIETVGPVKETSRAEVKLGWVQIAGRRVDAQRVRAAGGRDPFGRADRSGVEKQLREECRSIRGKCVPGFAFEDFECGNPGYRRIGWEIAERDAFVVAERVGHVGPVEEVLSAAKLFDGVFCEFMVLAPRHLVRLDRLCRGAGADEDDL